MAWGYGLKTVKRGIEDIIVTNVNNDEYIKLRNVDFGRKAAHTITFNAASAVGGTIEVRIDGVKGTSWQGKHQEHRQRRHIQKLRSKGSCHQRLPRPLFRIQGSKGQEPLQPRLVEA